jgi:hypothetical protein
MTKEIHLSRKQLSAFKNYKNILGPFLDWARIFKELGLVKKRRFSRGSEFYHAVPNRFFDRFQRFFR